MQGDLKVNVSASAGRPKYWTRNLLHRLAPAASLFLVVFEAHAADCGVRARIAMVEARTTYIAGDLIPLDLVIESACDPVVIRPGKGHEIDDVEVVPMDGVTAWRAEMESYEPRVGGDSFSVLPAQRVFRQRLAIGDRYHFDRPGTYQVLVRTRRAGLLVSNTIALAIVEEPLELQIEHAKVAAETVRTATSEHQCRRVVPVLNRRPDAAATDAKLALLIGPSPSRACASALTEGLWVARDRRRIVERLTAAITDPSADASVLGWLVETLADLEVSLAHPSSITSSTHVPGPRMERPSGVYWPEREAARERFLRGLASTFAARDGLARVEASRSVLSGWELMQKDQSWLMNDPDTLSAREVILSYDDAAQPALRWIGLPYEESLFTDPRMIPKLRRALQVSGSDALQVDQRDAATRMLARLLQ